MKKILSLLFAIVIYQLVVAQNVGIGTTTPNSSAALDVSSTTKGMLIPSMTTSQRFAILSPANGLMVYDTDKNEFHQYNGTSWKAILNGDYWSRPITTRSRISNLNDSVGVGINNPTERFDVNGNIRTNSSAIIDNASAILQLKSSGVNKGFMQLSGDNLRLGTNSGNATGNLVVRMNGIDRVTINPSGDIDLTGKITKSSKTGANSLLPVCYGYIDFDGTILSGTGNFNVNRISVGKYEINSSDFGTNAVIMVTTQNYDRAYGAYQFNINTLRVEITSESVSPTTFRDERFYFLVYSPQ